MPIHANQRPRNCWLVARPIPEAATVTSGLTHHAMLPDAGLCLRRGASSRQGTGPAPSLSGRLRRFENQAATTGGRRELDYHLVIRQGVEHPLGPSVVHATRDSPMVR